MLGKCIPVLEFLVLLGGVQWILGAFIEYRTPYEHFKYFMYVDEVTYMSYVVPAYVFFTCTLLYTTRKYRLAINIDQHEHDDRIGILLILLGFLAQLSLPYLPGGFQFVFYLISNFKYVGALLLYFSKSIRARKILFGAIIYLFVASLINGFFHEFLLWSVFFLMFWARKNKPSFATKILFLIFGISLSGIIQLVKIDYRASVVNDNSPGNISLFTTILNQRLSNGFLQNSDEQSELNIRLNQGWIISAVMEHTPKHQAFAQGETVIDAISASLLPRFLSPNKKRAEGRLNLEKFTNLELSENTSMGISILGESYANFGRIGGVFFMLCYGYFLKIVWQLIIRKSRRNFLFLYFVPLIFLHVVKAETELLIVLNYLVKASVICLGSATLLMRFHNKVGTKAG